MVESPPSWLGSKLKEVDPAKIEPGVMHAAIDRLEAFGPENMKDLIRSIGVRRGGQPEMVAQAADIVAQRLPYLRDFMRKMQRIREDNVGQAFRERGTISAEMMRTLGVGAAAGLGAWWLYDRLAGDDEPGTVSHEQKSVVADFLLDGKSSESLMNMWVDGQIPLTAEPFKRAIEAVEEMPDEEYLEMVTPAAYEQGIDPQEMLQRKHQVRETFLNAIAEAKTRKADTTGIYADVPTFQDIPDPVTGALIRQEVASDFPAMDPEPRTVGMPGPDPNDSYVNDQMESIAGQMPDSPGEAIGWLLEQGFSKKHAMTLLRNRFGKMKTAHLELFLDQARKGAV